MCVVSPSSTKFRESAALQRAPCSTHRWTREESGKRCCDHTSYFLFLLCTFIPFILNLHLSIRVSLINWHFNELFHFSQGLDGRQFISVLDLEDKALHHDLPPCLSPGAQHVPSVRSSSPTSAELHVLATSVIMSGSNAAAAAAAEPQPIVTTPEHLRWRSHTGLVFTQLCFYTVYNQINTIFQISLVLYTL